MDQYEQLDREALRVAFGDTERLVQLVTMAPPTVDAFEEKPSRQEWEGGGFFSSRGRSKQVFIFSREH